MVPYYLYMMPVCGLGKEAPSFGRMQLCAVQTAWGAKHRLVFSLKCLFLITLKTLGKDAKCALCCSNGCVSIPILPWDIHAVYVRDMIAVIQ